MKLRSIKNMPVFYADHAQLLGRVEKGVIDDNLKLLYLVVKTDAEHPSLIKSEDCIINDEAIRLLDVQGMKSYACGEELSIYDKKIGDRIFDSNGKELGILSDFVINPESKEVESVEISGGHIKDLLQGRMEVPISEVRWVSSVNAVVSPEGGEKYDEMPGM